VIWLWTGLLMLVSVPLGLTLWLWVLHHYLCWKYLGYLVRIFQEKPLFIIPRGQPVANAEDVRFPSTNGLTLRGCYLHAKTPRRRGVILFGLEFGSNRWSAVPYCESLRDNGYDVFAFEPRNQGESDCQPGYAPMQWVTDIEVEDCRAALVYLKGRADADANGIGFFGISKGAAAGLLAASTDPWVRCFVTDGVFATYTTMVPYMKKWFGIYNNSYTLQGLIPMWYYGLVGKVGLNRISKERHCRFPHLERAMPKLAPRPLFMIHGGGDTYIKPEMAEKLFDYAGQPKEFWMVDGAKHNQALHLVRDEYQRRVVAFFNRHFAEPLPAPEPTVTQEELVKTV
jgi:uncharacterized protein